LSKPEENTFLFSLNGITHFIILYTFDLSAIN